jgi:glycosyltransferase involved in cell wall biosynthesis
MDAFPDDDGFSLVELSTPTVEDGAIVYVKKLRDQWAKTKQLSETLNHAEETGIDVLHVLCLEFMQIPILLNDLFSSGLPPLVASLHRDIPFDQNYEAEGWRARVRRVAENVLMWANESAQSAALRRNAIQLQVVHAERIRRRVMERLAGSEPENTTAVPAPTPSVTAPEQADARDTLALPDEVPTVLFFGELRYDKGPDLLAKAMDGIDSPICVVFAGREAYFDSQDVEKWVESVETNAEFETRLEYIPEEEVDSYFTAADALVLPYRRQYGISGPLRRAVMAGTPVIGSDASDLGSIIERHDLGRTFERGNVEALRKVICEFLEVNSAIGGGGLAKRAEEIHWESVGSDFEELYDDVIVR